MSSRSKSPGGELRAADLWALAARGPRPDQPFDRADAHHAGHRLAPAARRTSCTARRGVPVDRLPLPGQRLRRLPAGRGTGIVRTYALRRAGRILPLYYLTIVLAVVLGGILRPVSGTDFPHDAAAVLAHLTFLHQEAYPYRTGFGVQGIVWTMSIAAVFYVAFGLVVRQWLRHPYLWLAASVLVTIAWRESIATSPDRLAGFYLQFPLFCADFGFGITGAYVYTRLHRGELAVVRRAAPLLCGVFLLALVGLLYLAGLPVVRGENQPWAESAPLAVLIPLVFTGFLITMPFVPARLQWLAGNRLMCRIGDVSYALFLFHFLVIWSVLRVIHVPRNYSLTSTIELAALVLPITLTAAWAATRWVERPLRLRFQQFAARLDQRSASRRAAVAAPATLAAAD